MKKVLLRALLVLGLAAAVVAPQAHWLLLSDDRVAMSAVQVETAAAQHYLSAESQVLDRLECEPISRSPGTSTCQAQDDGRAFGLVFAVADDGGESLHTAPAPALTAWTG